MDVQRKQYSVPSALIEDRRFNVEILGKDPRWKLTVPEGLDHEAQALGAWAKTVHDPVASYEHGVVDLPLTTQLAASVQQELDGGYGVAWVSGLKVEDRVTASLVYLAVGAAMGEVVETYGRLYEVIDRGDSYKKKAIPVSQTRESTGMHTDSSRVGNVPDYVGLLCLRQGLSGGGSRIVSSIQAHEALRQRDPRLLESLYRDFVRDVVTPGADRDPVQIAKNKFPVFQFDQTLTMRYMRYWIESGHRVVGSPLLNDEVAAMDALDEELARKDHIVRFAMAPGDMLWVANRVVAHDRDAYTDDPERPRCLLRQWVRRDDE
jgi:alpha-ketoglutarate-dependent taurine dioxygenase